MSCLKTWWTYQMPGDSLQGLARCQPRLGVGRRRLSKPEHSHSFQLKVRSVFAHKSSKSSKYSSAIWSYMIYFYNLKGSGGRYFSCHHVIAWASFPISGELRTRPNVAWCLYTWIQQSSISRHSSFQSSWNRKILNSDQVKLWKRVSKFCWILWTVQRSFWFLWSIGDQLDLIGDFPASISQ